MKEQPRQRGVTIEDLRALQPGWGPFCGEVPTPESLDLMERYLPHMRAIEGYLIYLVCDADGLACAKLLPVGPAPCEYMHLTAAFSAEDGEVYISHTSQLTNETQVDVFACEDEQDLADFCSCLVARRKGHGYTHRVSSTRKSRAK
jgi:hypothetical protein